jgi:hypothetical protein
MGITDPNPALRAELDAALIMISQQIAGLRFFLSSSPPEEDIDELTAALDASVRRQALINHVLSALDGAVIQLAALDDDGYPADVTLPVAGSQVISDLQAIIASAEAALSAIKLAPPPPGVSLDLDLADATHVPQPTPANRGP